MKSEMERLSQEWDRAREKSKRDEQTSNPIPTGQDFLDRVIL